MTTRPDTRTTAVHIMYLHGAYLISYSETTSNDGNATPIDLFECASSQRVAKRVARAGAIELGWRGPFTWFPTESGGFIMLATDDDGYERDDEL